MISISGVTEIICLYNEDIDMKILCLCDIHGKLNDDTNLIDSKNRKDYIVNYLNNHIKKKTYYYSESNENEPVNIELHKKHSDYFVQSDVLTSLKNKHITIRPVNIAYKYDNTDTMERVIKRNGTIEQLFNTFYKNIRKYKNTVDDIIKRKSKIKNQMAIEKINELIDLFKYGAKHTLDLMKQLEDDILRQIYPVTMKVIKWLIVTTDKLTLFLDNINLISHILADNNSNNIVHYGLYDSCTFSYLMTYYFGFTIKYNTIKTQLYENIYQNRINIYEFQKLAKSNKEEKELLKKTGITNKILKIPKNW